MSEYNKVLPVSDMWTRDYWEGAKRHELILKRCSACNFYIHPPMPTCPRCQTEDVRSAVVSGKGAIYSFTVMHHLGNPGFDEELPYAVVVVELDEQKGLLTVGNLLDCPLDRIQIGMTVEVTYQDVTEEVTLPQFQPVRAAG